MIACLGLIVLACSVPAQAQDLINIGGTIANGGVLRIKGQAVGLPDSLAGTFDFFGGRQTIPAVRYSRLLMQGTGIKDASQGAMYIADSLLVGSEVVFQVPSSTAVTLGGVLNELGYIQGRLNRGATLTGVASGFDFGGLGVTVRWVGTPPGPTTVTRVSGEAMSGNGNRSILRYYDLSNAVSSGLDATLTFRYDDRELNGHQAALLTLWRSLDGGVTWRHQGGRVDTVARTITLSGVTSFARWTAADSLHPLGPMTPEGQPWSIAIAQSSGQPARVGATIDPFIAIVRDAYGTVAPGVEVQFSIVSVPDGATGQHLSATSVRTGPDGRAAASLTLGDKAGTYTIVAQAAGLIGSPITFTASAYAGTVARLIVPVPEFSGRVMTLLAQPLEVRTVDAGGNAVGGVPINFTITSRPAGSLRDSLVAKQVISDSLGRASVRFLVGSRSGLRTITVTSPDLPGQSAVILVIGESSVPQTMTVFSGTGQLGIVQTPSNPLVVQVRDAFDNPVTGVGVNFAITGHPNGTVRDSLVPTRTVTDSAGHAATVLTFGTFAGAYAVTATTDALPGTNVTFLAVAVANPGPPSVISGSKGSGQRAAVRVQLPQPFSIKVTDLTGTPVEKVPVIFSIAGTPAAAVGQSLTDTLVMTGSQGEAATTLTLGNKAGTYTVTAASPNLLASPIFTAFADAAAPASLEFAAGKDQIVEVGAQLPTPVAVTVRDADGNPVRGVEVRFSFKSVPSGATGQGCYPDRVITDTSGVAATVVQLGDRFGLYTITATTDRIPGADIVLNAIATVGGASTLAMTSGTDQRTAIVTTLPKPFVVSVADAKGNPVRNVPVIFTIAAQPTDADGASLSATQVLTNELGLASTVFTLGSKVGDYTVMASSAGLVGSPLLFHAAATEGPPSQIVMLSGNDQSGTVAQRLKNPLTIGVLDAGENPVRDVRVDFTTTDAPVGANGQSLSVTSARTDSTGRASSSLLLGNKSGRYVVTASSVGLTGSPLQFSAVGIPGPAAALVAASPVFQTALVATHAPDSLAVMVTDLNGNPVQGISVSYIVASQPASSAGTALTIERGKTDASGHAWARLTLGDTPGLTVVRAIVEGLQGSPVEFTVEGTRTNTTISAIAGNGQRAVPSSELPAPLVVAVVDSLGRPVIGAALQFSVASVPSGAIGYHLSEVQTQTDSSGRASARFVLGDQSGVYRINVTSVGRIGSPVIFTVTAAERTPSKILITSGDRQEVPVGTSVPQKMTVQVVDSTGFPMEKIPVSFAYASIPSGASGQYLSVSNALTSNDGRAFTVASVGDKAGVYIVTATVPGLLSGPASFSVKAVAGAAMSASRVSGNNQRTEILTLLPNPFVVAISDIGGNPVRGFPVKFHVVSAPSGAVGQDVSDTTVVSDSSGRVRATLRLGNRMGTYTVRALAEGLAGSPIEFTASATPGAAATMTIASGNRQSAPLNTRLPDALSIAVTDAGGNPLSGVRVTFTILAAPEGAQGQMVLIPDNTTDVNGIAFTNVFLGRRKGEYRVQASSPGLMGSPLTFIATAGIGYPVALVRDQDTTTLGPVSGPLNRSFQVWVRDIDNNGVHGVPVQFVLTDSVAGSVGHRILRTLVGTDSTGLAVSGFHFGTVPGTFRIEARSGAMAPARYTATAVKVHDINGDYAASIGDLTAIVDHILGRHVLSPAEVPAADLDTNGVVDVRDLVLMNKGLLDGQWDYTLRFTPEAVPRAPGSAAIAVVEPVTDILDSIATISGSVENTDLGLRFNLTNGLPVRGVQIYVKFKQNIPAQTPDIVFPRAHHMTVGVTVKGRELRATLYHPKNIPIAADSGTLFRVPLKLVDLSMIDSVRYVISLDSNIAPIIPAIPLGSSPEKYPMTYRLDQNYPNPFNSQTIIRYSIRDLSGKLARVSVDVYDLLGRRVKTLFHGDRASGNYQETWDGTDVGGVPVASGVYFCRLIAKGYLQSIRMVVIR